jgi:hypothetical protein
MSHQLNAGQYHNISLANKSFATVSEFQYFGTTVTNQNYIDEKSKSKLCSGNACYHSVQNLHGRNTSVFESENLKGTDHLGDLSVNGRIILTL